MHLNLYVLANDNNHTADFTDHLEEYKDILEAFEMAL